MEIDGRVQVVSGFVRKDDKYLLVYDPKFRFWRVPGGKVEEGEREEETLRRELFEELDLEIRVQRYLGQGVDHVRIYGFPRKTITDRRIKYYECSIESGEIDIKEAKEVSEYKWLSLSDIKKIDNLEPAMRDFFSKNKF
jgi:8-oxo-dGTP pyrophosphatase MutT (NUDIX family)